MLFISCESHANLNLTRLKDEQTFYSSFIYTFLNLTVQIVCVAGCIYTYCCYTRLQHLGRGLFRSASSPFVSQLVFSASFAAFLC